MMKLLLVEKSRPGMKLYVGNVPYSTTGADLKSIFGDCGRDVSSARVTYGDGLIRRQSKGLGIVEIPDKLSASYTIEDLSACLVCGRKP